MPPPRRLDRPTLLHRTTQVLDALEPRRMPRDLTYEVLRRQRTLPRLPAWSPDHPSVISSISDANGEHDHDDEGGYLRRFTRIPRDERERSSELRRSSPNDVLGSRAAPGRPPWAETRRRHERRQRAVLGREARVRALLLSTADERRGMRERRRTAMISVVAR